MAVVFKNLKARRGPLSDLEIKQMMERTVLLHSAVLPNTYGEVAKAALAKKGGMGDSAVLFSSSKQPLQEIEAADFEVGVAMDFLGGSELAIKTTGHNGEKLCATMTVKDASYLALWLLAAVDHLSDHKGGLEPSEREALMAAKDYAGRMFLDMDGTEKRISGELQAEYSRRADAKHYGALAALERKAEETVSKKYESAIRRLAQAATMAPGVERSAMLEELSPVIRKAFGNE